MSTKRSTTLPSDETSTADPATAVIANVPATTPTPQAPDEHHGHGGHYTLGEDGVRRLVERTAERTTTE